MLPEDPNIELPSRVGLTIGIIGAVIISIGFIIDTIGEGIELSEILQRDEIDRNAKIRQKQQFNQIQSKLDFLIGEIEELKKRG
ncbi:hypothetical protein [Psychrobacillus sp. L4]|uniref:hypothetical protein n=1 Tax=Psychrobacillus sp. L4 TaxID=3236892 RepID=UPI0036F3F7AA